MNGKLIAFTFDDGPSQYTETLLNGLASRNVSVTFFMNGENGTGGSCGIRNGHEKLLSRMWREGHQLANHTYRHAALHKLSAEQIISEVAGVEELIFDAAGGNYRCLVRTPGGHADEVIVQNVNAPIILWSVDTLDWKYRDANDVYNRILSLARNGSIVLMHDIYETSIEGALRAIDALAEQGYEFVTVSELMRRTGITMVEGMVYSKIEGRKVIHPGYEAPVVTVLEDPDTGLFEITCSACTGLSVYYTTNGEYPRLSDNVYKETVLVRKGTVFTAIGVDQWGTRTPPAMAQIGLSPESVPSNCQGLTEH